MVYRPQLDEQLCFVLMPFAEPFTGYYIRIIKPTVAEMGLKAIRSDEIYGTNAMIHDIWRSIWKARIVIADVTTKNPNVNYELGLCHALGIPTILIAKTIEDVPFDYRHRRCIIYDISEEGWEYKLSILLKRTIEAALLDKEPGQDLPWPYDTFNLQLSDSPARPRVEVPVKFLGKTITLLFMTMWVTVGSLGLLGLINLLAVAVIFLILMIDMTVVVLSYTKNIS